ncbi:MAG: hypothetical protein PHX62_08230, partial [Bacilli bacterium]|nr:hypothetical protein [Bacilli bacterium]
MKKILTLLTLVIGLAVLSACGGQKYPEISNPNDAYFTAKEGEYTYTFSNKQVYDELKTQVGLNLLIDLFDQDLLKATKKDNKSYWELVTTEEINEKMDEDIFPTGTDNLSETEIEDFRNDYYDRMFIQYGFNSETEIRDYYRLNLAKSAYAYDRLVEKYDEEDFTEKQYQDYYDRNYKTDYYAIVVAYETPKLVNQALEVWDRKIVDGKWTTLSGTELTEQEIIKTFIDLYNSANAYKVEDYPESTLLLNLGVDAEYKLVEDKIVFNLENLDELFYTNSEISAFEPLILKELATTLKSYNQEGNFYSASPLSNSVGSRHYLVMKIGEEVPEDFAAAKSEIRKELLDGNLTSTFISTEMAKLRAENNLVIYDDEIEEKYTNQVLSYSLTHERTKKLNGDLVAKTDLNEYTADDLFILLSEGYGLTLVAS